MSKPITITTQPYFEGSIRLLGYLLIVIGLLLIEVVWIGTIICLTLSLVILTANYKLRIDPSANTIKDFLKILWLENGNEVAYQKLEYVFIKDNQYTQTMSRVAISSTIRFTLYSGYLVVDGEKYFLGENKNYSKTLIMMQEFASLLKIEFRDNVRLNLSVRNESI